MGKVDLRLQRGFTLIEMSIVLVIIGLIIGGILKGQELIESARQKNLVSEIDAVRSAAQNFQDNFKSMPGDYGFASTNINSKLGNGNNDGFVATTVPFQTTAAAMASAAKNTGEELQFFNHLAAANMLAGASVTASTTITNFAGGPAPSPIPAGPWPSTGLSVIYGTHPGATATNDTKTTHWLIASKFNSDLEQSTSNGAMPASRAFQLDNKYDDGLPMSGSIRTFGLTANCGAVGTDAYTPTSQLNNECEVVFALQ